MTQIKASYVDAWPHQPSTITEGQDTFGAFSNDVPFLIHGPCCPILLPLMARWTEMDTRPKDGSVTSDPLV